MDESARKALIRSSVVVAKNFVPLYTHVNQRWMIDKTLAVIESRGGSDAAIKSKVTDTVTKAKALVKKHRDFELKLKINKKEAAMERTLRQRRVQILYSLIAHEPDPAGSADKAQPIFIARPKVDVGSTHTNLLANMGTI